MGLDSHRAAWRRLPLDGIAPYAAQGNWIARFYGRVQRAAHCASREAERDGPLAAICTEPPDPGRASADSVRVQRTCPCTKRQLAYIACHGTQQRQFRGAASKSRPVCGGAGGAIPPAMPMTAAEVAAFVPHRPARPEKSEGGKKFKLVSRL